MPVNGKSEVLPSQMSGGRDQFRCNKKESISDVSSVDQGNALKELKVAWFREVRTDMWGKTWHA